MSIDRIKLLLAAGLAVVLLHGCAPKETKTTTRVGLVKPGTSPGKVEWKPEATASKAPAVHGKGQPWTIECIALDGPFAEQHIKTWADQLKRMRGLKAKDVSYEQSADGKWHLYYGTYYRHTDPTTGTLDNPEELTTYLRGIRSLASAEGQALFAYAIKVPKPMPCDDRPEWELSRVEAKYSLQVAVFLPTDDFQNYKQAAVEYCEFLRKKGLEAYYHHCSASSVVTVGAFGEGAVKKGVRKIDALDKGVVATTEYGPEVEALRRKDELLQYNLVNGQIHRVRAQQDWSGRPVTDAKPIPVESMLVEIPNKENGER